MATVTMRDGEQLNVICIGKGKPVVLLHGFGSRASHWLPNILPFIGQYRFYLPDLRGFGGSHHAQFFGEHAFAVYARDLEDLLNHFELDNVALGGISTGAYTCLMYNKEFGFDRVNKYLNIEHSANSKNDGDLHHGLFGPDQEKMFADFRSLMELAEAHGMDTPYWALPPEARIQFRHVTMRVVRRAFNSRLARRVATVAATNAEPLLTRYLMQVDRWQVYLELMCSFMQGNDTTDALHRIKVPTTVMIGKQSRYFTESAQRELVTHIPHADVVVFEKSGHIPIIEEPIKFQREFARFLRGG